MIASIVQSGTLGAAQDTVALGCAGYAAFGVRLTTFTGTVTFEGSTDGVTFSTMTVTSLGGSGVTTTTGAGQWLGSCAGLKAVRVRMSAYTSGTAQAFLRAVPL